MLLTRIRPGVVPAFLTAVLLLAFQPAGAQRLRVAFVGDPQVDSEAELAYARKSVYRELGSRKDVDLAVFLGDLVNDKMDLLAPSRATLDSLPFPWACVPGNHDRDIYGQGRGRDMASYRRIIGTTDTTFVRGGVRFILMDDVRGKGSQGYEAGFREDQKAWLSAVLDDTQQGTLAVLSAHIPFSEFKAMDSLETILSRHPRLLLMSAHTHTMARHTLVFPAGLAVEEVLAGATCGSWWRGVPDERGIPRSYQNCGAPPCYYLADFSGGAYRLDYKTIGRPASEKASAWVVDSTRLVLNVYGGATGGKVRVKLPGRLRWITVPASAEAAPEQIVVNRFNKTLDAKGRARNPLHIPMRLAASPHVWAIDLSGSPRLLSALRRAGKRVKIRYSDPSLSFSTSVAVSVL
ncbi:MAG: calcineurin-like phosphoesterase C-terminal domain-containing protein [Bacteroidales bacterium]|nr:calcineurin-like phosphoesterase C-terminal domain-containing protein [Bacteroidales bacterium]